MTARAERLNARFFGRTPHPYRIFDTAVRGTLPRGGVILDAGCGRTAPILTTFRGAASRLVGVDLVEFTASAPDLELHRGDLTSVPIKSGTIDVIMARSVMEHVEKPLEVYREMYRLLKPGGHFVFLTANLWDYTSLIAMAVPNRWHPWIVSKVEGREPEDVFPTFYRTNTARTIHRLSKCTNFEVARLEYLGQYPAYFMFNSALFLLATAYEKLISRFNALAFLRGWILVDLVKR